MDDGVGDNQAPVLCPHEGCKSSFQEAAINREDFKTHEHTCEFAPNALVSSTHCSVLKVYLLERLHIPNTRALLIGILWAW